MLLNSFYTVSELRQEAQELHAVIHINPAHAIFEGHFPGQPVVPGVCMVQIVKELTEQITAKKLLFSKGHQIKFLQLLVPAKEDALQVTIALREEDGCYHIQSGLKKNNESVFKLSGIFRPL